VARWTDTTSYANLPAPDDADLLPIADVSAAEGSRQRTITWGQLASAAAGALDDLTDVDTTGASDGDVLTYDDGDWVPKAPTGGGDIALADGLVVVQHGDDDSVARPAAGSVYWQGSVEPANQGLGDLWFETDAFDGGP
jgi:hypothetical protein